MITTCVTCPLLRGAWTIASQYLYLCYRGGVGSVSVAFGCSGVIEELELS